MKFTKMQGLGNDYLYVNGFEQRVECPEQLAVKMSDRHFGAGSDGLVLILPDETADFRMRMFNADGSEAEMCGNAARCVGKYVFEKGLTKKKDLLLQTGSGLRRLQLKVKEGSVQSVRVDMGVPRLRPAEIPVSIEGEQAIRLPLQVDGNTWPVTCVSMGNPHAVTFVPDPDAFDVHGVGRKIECHPLFPARTNVEFARVLDRSHVRMRVWERGSGETLACGTGACATLVAGVLCGLCDRKATLVLNGGELLVEWEEASGHVFQEGPAVFVYEGEWPEA